SPGRRATPAPAASTARPNTSSLALRCNHDSIGDPTSDSLVRADCATTCLASLRIRAQTAHRWSVTRAELSRLYTAVWSAVLNELAVTIHRGWALARQFTQPVHSRLRRH